MGIPTLPGVTTTALIVDLSHNQADADLDAARSDDMVIAAIVKATEGATFQDPGLAGLFAKASAASLKIGVYHFGTAADPKQQVDNFVKTVTDAIGGFDKVVPVLDLEHNDPHPSNTISFEQAEAWVGEFKARTGRTPLLYAGDFLRAHGGAVDLPNLAGCPLWVADYRATPHDIAPWNAGWSMWQFTDGTHGPNAGEVSGIGACDQNVFQGDQAAFDQFWKTFSGG